MTQYIDKDALVEYIGQRYIEHQIGNQSIGCLDRMDEDKVILSFADTLQSKESVLLTPEEIKKICTIYDNLKQERECATVLYNSDETFFNHVLMVYKSIAQKEETLITY